jgi:magnesium-transporting ATPase (P-type)
MQDKSGSDQMDALDQKDELNQRHDSQREELARSNLVFKAFFLNVVLLLVSMGIAYFRHEHSSDESLYHGLLMTLLFFSGPLYHFFNTVISSYLWVNIVIAVVMIYLPYRYATRYFFESRWLFWVHFIFFWVLTGFSLSVFIWVD